MMHLFSLDPALPLLACLTYKALHDLLHYGYLGFHSYLNRPERDTQ